MKRDAVVLVTGASRGIGRETARQFALAGCRVGIHALNRYDLAGQLADELNQAGCQALALQADVRDRKQVDAMVARLCKTWGPVDVLVNNAGIAQQKLFTDISEQDWDQMFASHVKGTFHCCQAVIPDMVRRQAGKIINISSIWGMTGASCEVHYAAAKAAVIGLTKSLAKELGPSHIQVNCVAPGIIETDMIADLDAPDLAELQAQTPLGSIGSPADVAHTICFLASEKAAFITGQVISPNGGFLI